MPSTRVFTTLAACTISLAAISPVAPAHAGSPSFDCARADSRAEELICGDRELARMDMEATRLFRLVRDTGKRSEGEKKTLNEDRARWLGVRDACWISANLRNCVIASYALRIHFLREKHAEARSSDDKGITKGPYAWRCKDFKDPVKATFIRSDPPVGTVQLPDSVHVGIGSGTRYMERGEAGGLLFWTEGENAYLKLPNGMNYRCSALKQ